MGKIKTALVSLWDKSNIDELAGILKDFGIRAVSTGNTAKVLRDHGVEVIEVADYTGADEILNGRVKTLHPKVHAGLLYRRDSRAHMQTIKDIGAYSIDLVVVNLYPFKDAFESGKKGNDLLEFIDIGGPTMIRAGAKNYPWVTVISSVEDYGPLRRELEKHKGETSLNFRKKMAGKAFALTGLYDARICSALGYKAKDIGDDYLLSLDKELSLRYGENPHQEAGFYMPFGKKAPFKLLGGKELSYNNIMDMASAYEMAMFFGEPASVVVKHSNPCGLAVSGDLKTAYVKAYKADSMSAFGGIVAFNGIVKRPEAEAVIKSGFREVVIAPGFDKDAVGILKQKKNLRIVKARPDFGRALIRPAFNGYLIQKPDAKVEGQQSFKVVTKKKPTKTQLKDLEFAWNVVRFVKSNAIVIAKGMVTVGIGAGQMSRVDAVELAIKKAGDKVNGCVLASDAFFPKVDNIEFAAKAGVKAIVQPGGSKADPDVIEKCDELGIAMAFTGSRHFKH